MTVHELLVFLKKLPKEYKTAQIVTGGTDHNFYHADATDIYAELNEDGDLFEYVGDECMEETSEKVPVVVIE